jgi:ATP-dependent Clp protease ATP-binding subunit ClpC
VVRSQKYEEAAKLRDREKRLLEELESAKMVWEEQTRNQKFTVGEDDIAAVVAMMTGIPVKRIGQSEGSRLLHMGDDLKKRVIGQDKAVEKLTRTIQRTRAGLKDPNRPIGFPRTAQPAGLLEQAGLGVIGVYLEKLRHGPIVAARRSDLQW